jgi:glycosyltransferase involved in cell wall biosynthesis
VLTRRPHLLHVFSTFVPAGPELRTVRLIEAFGDRYRHSVVAIDGRTTAADCLGPGLDVRVVDAPVLAGSIRTTAALCGLARRLAPDLVLTYNWGAFDMLLAARLLRFRRVLHHEDGFNADEATTLKRRRSFARRIVCRGIARVIVPSHSLERIALCRWGLHPHAVSRIPNGIAPLTSTGGPPARVREEAAIGPSSRVLATVAHLRPEKRLDRLIDAVARLSAGLDAHLLVVGDGPERGVLVDHAAAAGIGHRVHFLGHRTDVHAILAAADLFVLSSDTEQMPISLLEAMAAGLPVVATRVGDVADMLPPEHGQYAVSVDGESTAAALADRITGLLSQPALRAAVGRANMLRVREEYGFDRMRDAYLAEYERALAGCPR